MSNEKTYPGLVIRSHKVRDAGSKKKAQDTMSGWQSVEQTAAEWLSDLEQGHTIQPSLFTPKKDGNYTHAKEYWQGTYFVCADADYIRGVEFTDKLQRDLDGLISDAKLTQHETGADGNVRVDCPFNQTHTRDACVGLDNAGYPFFKCNFRKDPIKVVIASYEEDLSETWKRIASVCDWLGWSDYDKLAKQIRFVDLKMFGPLWGVGQDTHLAIRAKLLEVGDWLLKECKDFGARLLMLDPSAGVYGANENARESVREFCSHLNGWGQQVNCATLLIAHPNKAGEYSGNTDWLGSCRAMWKLGVEEENRGTKNNPEWHYWYQLTNVKQNYAAPQRAVYLKKIKDGTEWTPIWVKLHDKKEAEEFYKEYRNPTEQSTRNGEDTTQEDTDDDPLTDLIANSL